MKQRWLALATLLCLLWMSAATAEEAIPTLTFSWWGDEAIHAGTLEGINEFHKANKKGPVILTRTWDDSQSYLTDMQELWSAGNAGDVVELDWEMLTLLAKDDNGWFRLSDLGLFPKQLDLDQFDYISLMNCIIDERVCAVPTSVSSHVFFWNTSALGHRKASAPADTASLVELAASLRLESGTQVYPLAASAQSRIALLITYLQSQYGQRWFNEKTNQLSFTLEQVSEGMRYLHSFERAGVWPSLAEQGDILEGWRSGRYLGIWSWDSSAGELAAAFSGNASMETTARLSDWTPYSGGFVKVNRVFAIPADSMNPKAAAQLIQFLLSSDKAVRAMGGIRGTPVHDEAMVICNRFRLLDTTLSSANATALSWSRYPIPYAFEDPSLIATDGVYRQVLEGLSSGAMTDRAAAAALLSGINLLLE